MRCLMFYEEIADESKDTERISNQEYKDQLPD